jgi:hypothetical protein
MKIDKQELIEYLLSTDATEIELEGTLLDESKGNYIIASSEQQM